MINPEIAKRYAVGLFYAALKHQVLDRVLEEQNSLASLLKEQPEFRSFLEVPQIQRKEKEELIKGIFLDKLHPVFYHFLLLLLNKHRLNYLIPITEEYEKLVKEHKGVIQAKITTAIPLEKSMVEKLKDKLEKKSGKKIEILLKVEPAIIGGITLILGNQIIDNSISHHLNQLKEEMLELRVH